MQAESEAVAAAQEITDSPLVGSDVQQADESPSTEQDDSLGSESQEAVEALLDNQEVGEESGQDGNDEATETTDQEQNILVEQETVDKSGVDRVVFVDDNIKDFDLLLEGVATDVSQLDESFNVDGLLEAGSLVMGNTEIVVLDHEGDELSQISEILAGYDELNSVHIYSYGSQNSLTLGDTTLTTANLDSYSTQITGWGEALSENGDFLLYGCNIAQDVTENNFIEAFAQLTDADVAASDDQTGNQASGGDWDLEVTSGEVEATALQDVTGQWDGLLDPAADSTISADNTEPMINSTFSFEVTFDNTDVDVGYGPFVDVYVPAAIEITGGPEYFGETLSHEIYTWEDGAWTYTIDGVVTEVSVHPYDSEGVVLDMPVGVNDGDKWYLVEHSFGSFTPDQPIATITFEATTSDSAQVGVGVGITSQAGFRYGDTATNDNGPIQEAAAETLTITPQVIDIEKSDNLTEAQTVTGPNYPVTYTLTVNVAAGETVGDVIVQDYLPENAVYRGDVTITNSAGAEVDFSAGITAPIAFDVLGSDTAERLLTINLGEITGVPDAVDASADGTAEYTITYSVYFSDVQSGSSTLLPGIGGDVNDVLNESSITGTYNTLTVSDGVDDSLGTLNGNDNDTLSDSEIQIASLVASKDVTVLSGNDPAPGEILEWTIEVDISDYYTADNIVLNDVFGDGQTFDENFTPTLVVSENGTTTSYIFDDTNYIVGVEDSLNDVGDTALTFNVSTLLAVASAKGDGTLDGSVIAGDGTASADEASDILNDRPGGDATRFFVVYHTRIDENYDEFQDANSGDASVDIGDEIYNRVTVNADISDGTTDTDGNLITEAQDDSSADSVTIPGGTVAKSIYAVNGDTGYDLSQGVQVGDEVTYRLTMTLPSADFEHLVVKDFLPLPVYNAIELTEDATDDFVTVGSTVAGVIAFGPDHNLSSSYINGLVLNTDSGDVAADTFQEPTVTVDSTNNSIELDFGSYDATAQTDAVIDILITVTINNEAIVDGLRLTNQGEWSINDTNQTPDTEVEIQQVVLNAPVVEIVKGVVGIGDSNGTLDAGSQGPLTFNADGTITLPASGLVDAAALIAAPVDAELTGADGGDVVTFALTIYNTGGDDAYDINVTDTLPTGFVTPTDISDLNLHVYQGSSETEINPDDYVASLNGTADTLTVNFEGVALTTGNADGENGDGSDVFIVTYQLTVDNEIVTDTDIVTAGSTHTNTATVDFFTGVDDSDTNWTEILGEPTDDAAVTIAEPTVVKSLVGTEINDGTNANNEAVIGELVTYQVVVTLPEGMTEGAMLSDQLDTGLTFVELVSVTPSSTTDISSSAGDFSTVTNFTATTDSDNVLTIVLGNITNSNDDNSTDATETVTIVYTAFVSNDAANQSGETLTNAARITFTGGDGTSDSSSAETVTVIEPDLQVIKDVEVNGVAGNTSGDAGDPVVYTIVIQHSSGSETTAYDVDFSDDIPVAIDIDTSTTWLTVTDNANTVTASDFTLTDNLLTLNGTIDMLEGRVITLTVSGTLAEDVAPEQTITNSAGVTWHSLGDDVTPQYYDGSTNERTGDGGVNDYSTSDGADIDIFDVGITKTLINTGIEDTFNARLEATIGETVTYEVVLAIPEGQLTGAQLVDVLDEGLQFVAGQVIATSVSSGLTLTTDPITSSVIGTGETGDPQTITFDLGTVTHAATSGSSAEETVTIRYTAIVLDDAVNFDGETVDNAAKLIWDAGSSVTVDAEDVTIIEPWIETLKTVDQTTGVEGGDTLTYTVSMTNDGNATAYEVNFTDTLAQGTSNITITGATIDGVATGFGPDTITDISAGSDGSVLLFSDSTWNLAPGSVLVVTYTADVGDDAVVDGAHTNYVDADWSNQLGDVNNDGDPNTIERIYDDSGSSPVDPVDGENDESSATFTMPEVTISKTDSTTVATIGDEIEYVLRLETPQGTISNLNVTDVLSAGLIYNGNAEISYDNGATYSTLDPAAVPTNNGSTAVTLIWAMGDTELSSSDDILIRYTATVADVSSNFDGGTPANTLSNSVTLSYTDAEGVAQGNTATDSFEIVEPWITTVKTVTEDTDVEGGDTLTYTVSMTNDGAATAYEVNFTDILAQGTGNITITGATIDDVATGVGLGTITDISTDSDGSVLLFSDSTWNLALTAGNNP